ncbi:uncharacterized protein DNG_05695 [Cephalotrichum gorgonifer]|uniref:NADH dehydrogenase [ubiquinone] 1 alpha subcomplex subunit n=1 Tax=Cephalotrichum gorgonifer TaxID=2041049 RepID=A0AAE8SVZ5_9PEZI|nr:uncharacterized protein DNG_05695 [Cephalotrichum gorgonifer]
MESPPSPLAAQTLRRKHLLDLPPPRNPPSNWRRIVHYPRSTHLSEVKVPPQWHSWLRYTRSEAPTMDEQIEEAARQDRIKMLAAQADRRWEAKPKVMEDGPNMGQTPSLGPSVPSVEGTGVPNTSATTPSTSTNTTAGQGEWGGGAKAGKNENPWATTKGPSEDWTPQSWTPTPKR